MKRAFPRRAIHLDYHTGPDIPDVAAEFDAKEFAETFAAANVDSVTLFAKCHHGHLYYATERPERHPSLPKNLDLLAEQVEALHSRGIQAPLYLSVLFDEYSAKTHPEWCALYPEGKVVKMGGVLDAGWYLMDMSSPYQDYLADQLAEVLKKFAPLDGLFLDICWDVESCSRWAIDGMRKRGFDPHSHDERMRYAREVSLGYMARFKKMVDDAHKNTQPVGIWFNSRPKTNLHNEKKFFRHVEIECLPTGGWGYAYFPYVSRFVRPLGLPTLAMTARFHRGWADFGGIKSPAALKYECSSALSQTMSNSIGDQLHPRGRLDKAAYELIGIVYGHIKSCEQWVYGAKQLSQIAVIIDPSLGDNPKSDGLGVVRALTQLRQQFDLISAEQDFKSYELVIVPESIKFNQTLKTKLQSYVKSGGSLIIAADAAHAENGNEVMKEMGVTLHGASPHVVTYLRIAKSISAGIADLDHVLYERGLRITANKDAEILGHIVEPYFERSYDHFCSHCHTPPDKVSRFAGVVQNGRVITIAFPIFSIYGAHGNISLRQVLGKCIDRLVPEPLIRDNGPSGLEATIMCKGGTTIVHLLSFSQVRRTADLDIIEDTIPLVDMTLSVKLDQAPQRVVLAPQGVELPFEYSKGRAVVKINTTDGHVMIIFKQ